MPSHSASEQIKRAVLAWPGVTARPHRYGGTEYRLARREIGHVHADALVDVPFPIGVRNEIVAAGLAEPHHVLPDTGWVSFYIREPADVDRAVALLRRSFDLAISRKSVINRSHSLENLTRKPE